MAVNRQAIFDALAARVRSVSDLKMVSSRIKLWDKVPPEQQPAAFIEVLDQTAEGRDPGCPSLWVLRFAVYVYVHDTGSNGPAATLTSLVDRIQAAIEEDPQSTPSTLGGLVIDVRVTQVQTDHGALGDQGVALIDIEARTAS